MKYLFGFAALVLITVIIGCAPKPQPVLSATDQFKYAKNLYDKGKYFKAQTAFENLIYTYPGNTVIDTAQYYLGMCDYQQKEYGLAIGEFKRLLAAYPQSAYADDAQYWIAICHYKLSPKYSLDQDETYRAIDEFNTLLSDYPGTPYREDALAKIRELENKLAEKKYKAGLLYFKLHDYEPALIYFGYVRDNYPSTDWAVRAFYYTGEAQLKLGRYDEALTTFNNFLAGYGNHELAERAKKKIEEIAGQKKGEHK